MTCKCRMKTDLLVPSVHFYDCGAVYIDTEEYVPAITAKKEYLRGITAMEMALIVPARNGVLQATLKEIRAVAKKLRKA